MNLMDRLMERLDRLGRRPALIAGGWVVAAVLAVLAGLVGISVIGDGLTTRQAEPVDEAEIVKELSGLTASASPPPSSSPPSSSLPSSSLPPSSLAPTASDDENTPSPTASVGSRPDVTTLLRTRGGTVVADCAGIISMSPAQGFAVHEQRASEGEFRGVSDRHDRVKIDLACSNGVARLSER